MDWLWQNHFPLGHGRGLTGRWTSLALTRWFLINHIETPFLGEAETVNKSQFGDMGLSISDTIWGLLSCFFLIFYLFIHERHRERERERQREKQAPCREPNAGLHPVTPESRPGPKVALNHWATRAAWIFFLIVFIPGTPWVAWWNLWTYLRIMFF